MYCLILITNFSYLGLYTNIKTTISVGKINGSSIVFDEVLHFHIASFHHTLFLLLLSLHTFFFSLLIFLSQICDECIVRLACSINNFQDPIEPSPFYTHQFVVGIFPYMSLSFFPLDMFCFILVHFYIFYVFMLLYFNIILTREITRRLIMQQMYTQSSLVLATRLCPFRQTKTHQSSLFSGRYEIAQGRGETGRVSRGECREERGEVSRGEASRGEGRGEREIELKLTSDILMLQRRPHACAQRVHSATLSIC